MGLIAILRVLPDRWKTSLRIERRVPDDDHLLHSRLQKALQRRSECGYFPGSFYVRLLFWYFR